MGWMELMVVGVVALIVVGPKDLPVMFQSLGKMTAKVKRMAREFSSAMNDAADASGARDIAKDLKGLNNPAAFGMDKLKEAAEQFDKWEPGQTQKAMGSETAKLAAERAEAARKIHDNAAKVAQARIDREKAEAAENTVATDAAPPKTRKPANKAAAKPKAKPAAKPKAAAAAKPKAAPKAKAKPASKAKPKAKPASKET